MIVAEIFGRVLSHRQRAEAMLTRLVQFSLFLVMAAATLGWLALIVSFIGKLAIYLLRA
jgi:hypothetical protein